LLAGDRHPAETALPQVVADDDHRDLAGFVAGRPEHSSGQWRHTEDTKQIAGRNNPFDALGLLTPAERELAGCACGYRIENTLSRLPVGEVGERHAHPVRRGRRLLIDPDQAFLVWVRRGPEHQAVDNTENRHINANPEG
jgi:hypothetical protein